MEKLTKAQKAIVDLIRNALIFADFAAGEGICAVDEKIQDPDCFLYDYCRATDEEDWGSLADRVAERVGAALAKEQRE
jgi:hypothetical protein